MNFTQLECFLTSCQTLNFTQAANRLLTSRQSVSRSVKELERELGVALFAREGGSLALTVEGKEVARRAERIFEEVEGIKRVPLLSGFAKDPLWVLAGPSVLNFTPYAIPDVLALYDDGACRVSEYSCRTCYEKILAGEGDVAIMVCMERDFAGCESVKLSTDVIYALVGADSPLAEKGALSITDLAGCRLLMMPDYDFQFAPLVEKYRVRHIDERFIDVVSSFGFVTRTVRSGKAVGLASAALKSRTPRGTVVKPLQDSDIQICLYLVFRADSPKIDSIATLVSMFQASVSSEEPQ